MILQTITIGIMLILLARYIKSEHKKTRKETQEIKTRLTNIRKHLHTIEREIKF